MRPIVWWATGALLLATVGVVGIASRVAEGATAPIVSSHGVAGVRFGTPKSQAVKDLTDVLGSPTKRFASNGCGPNFTEVEWGHLYAEFRRDTFTGFRYLRGGWEGHAVPPGATGRVRPGLMTPNGVSLASTLSQVRLRYGTLKAVGTDRWQSRDGLIFYVNSLANQPPPPTSRILEIKYGTCGDW